MNELEVVKLMEEIKAIHPLLTVNEETVIQWQRLLAAWDLPTMERAALLYNSRYSKAPKPADLLNLAKSLKEAARRAERAKAERAYLQGARVYKCPYCLDRGLVLVEQNDGYTPLATICHCRREDPAGTKKQIEQAGWQFDFKEKMWRRQV